MFQIPIDEGEFEADVESRLFGFDPLMAEDFFSFGEELPIQGRIIERKTAGGTIHVEWRNARFAVRSGLVTPR